MGQAFVFPGQGSQAVGMGLALAQSDAAARQVFAEVDDALGRSLSTIAAEGPEELLTATENAQPALMAVSIAVLRMLEARGLVLSDAVSYVAGHSLGEYSALVAAGALPLSDAARLLELRGQAMQRAAPVGVGAMAAILGLGFKAVSAIADAAAEGDEICVAANDNTPEQVVISGHAAAVERAMEAAKAEGAKRAVPLPVSAPFHCPLMQPAAEEMRAALADAPLSAPAVPLIANITAAPVSEAEDIRRLLVEQITGRVRWRESLVWLAGQGVSRLAELGSGKALTGMARRIDPSFEARAVNTPEDVDSFMSVPA